VRALPYRTRGTGRPLVLLHGFLGDGAAMDGLATALGSGYEAIAPDLPGHGRAADRVAAVDGFTACLDDLAATLAAAGHASAHWLGYSMGARIALAFALRHPARVRSLVLVAGRAGIADAGDRAARLAADATLAARIEAIGMPAFAAEWLAQPLFATLARLGPERLAAEAAARSRQDPAGVAAALRALGPAAQPPLQDRLGELQVPVLLIAGALDAPFVAHARALAAAIPQAQLAIVPDAGHAVHSEQPDACTGLVHDFLTRTAALADSAPSTLESHP
jgi:2-succinyl-6-hydroxy-2,4-cyclohexadiene-1-carboxylate synthase